ncbi:glutathione binding-like protein [Sorangium sp. So ce315]|uniref:glutathione binding-like protein n=1 Tax=Sorangium sp. So ce315 TaxID=3133299 RepID=UPI003F63A55D
MNAASSPPSSHVRPYIVGERCTLVDLDLVAMLGWGLMAAKIDVADLKNLTGWLGRVAERPAVKAATAAEV